WGAFYVWNPGSGFWSTASRWNGNQVPVSNANTQLIFQETAPYFSNDNLASPFLLSTINFSPTGSGQVTLLGGTLQLVTGSNGGPEITQDGTASVVVQNPVLIGASASFSASPDGPLSVTGAIAEAPSVPTPLPVVISGG